MDKDVVCVHTHNGILLSHKKNEIMPFVEIWVDLEMILPSEVNQRKTNIWYNLYVESKKQYKWTYLQNRNRLTEIETTLMTTEGEGVEEG